jgi:hypothetical protein
MGFVKNLQFKGVIYLFVGEEVVRMGVKIEALVRREFRRNDHGRLLRSRKQRGVW